jgi:hypothetical protein
MTDEQRAAIESAIATLDGHWEADELRALLADGGKGDAVAWTAHQLYDAIEEVLLHHHVSNMEGDDGEAYPLVDQLTTPGANSIESGKFEIRLICDAIYNEVLTVAAPQAECAPREAQPFVMCLDDVVEMWNSTVAESFEDELMEFAVKAINFYKNTLPGSAIEQAAKEKA